MIDTDAENREIRTILAVDASCSDVVVCIIKSGVSLASINIIQRQHSKKLAASINQLLLQADLTWLDISHVAFISGPGSFTGLRIAAATLNGINTALKLPIHHYSSLSVSAVACGETSPIYVLEDARSGEVFSGHYHQHAAIDDDVCLEWQEIIEKPPALYTGTNDLHAQMPNGHYLPPVLARNHALAKTIWDGFSSTMAQQYATPCYLQRSQAERNQR